MRCKDRHFQAATHLDIREGHRHQLLHLRILDTEIPGHFDQLANRVLIFTILLLKKSFSSYGLPESHGRRTPCYFDTDFLPDCCLSDISMWNTGQQPTICGKEPDHVEM